MEKKILKTKILLIDDNGWWLRSLEEQLSVNTTAFSFDSFESAQEFISSSEVNEIDAAIVDVRLRQPMYDQGGLGLMDQLKDKRPNLPILLLTDFASDYPGIHEVTQRYASIFIYEKSVFRDNPQPILEALLARLPPQIGNKPHLTRDARNVSLAEPDEAKKGYGVIFRAIVGGVIVIALLFCVAWLFFLLAGRFASFGPRLDVVFAVAMVTVLCVLLSIFQPQVVSRAVGIFTDLARPQSGSRQGMKMPPPQRRKRSKSQSLDDRTTPTP